MNDLHKFAYSVGSVLASARLGAPIQGSSQPVRIPRSESFSRALVKFAANAYVETGATDKLGYFIFKGAGDLNRWSDTAESLADIVARSLGKQAMERSFLGDLTEEELAKEASSTLFNMIGRGAALTPDVAKALLGGSLVVGGVGGGLTWAANRAIKEDEDDIEAMKAKIQTYRRLTGDIENELATRAAA